MCHEFYQKSPGSVVNFSRLFSQAWCKAVNPANIIARFRRAGVYPYNPNAITLTENTNSDMCITPSSIDYEPSTLTPTTTSLATAPVLTMSCAMGGSSACLSAVTTTAGVPTPSSSENTSNTASSIMVSVGALSADEVEHFECRCEAGYDVPDAVYEEWLKLHHPELSQTSVHVTFPPTLSAQELSLSEQLSAVTPLTPVAVDIHSNSASSSSSSSCSGVSSAPCDGAFFLSSSRGKNRFFRQCPYRLNQRKHSQEHVC